MFYWRYVLTQSLYKILWISEDGWRPCIIWRGENVNMAVNIKTIVAWGVMETNHVPYSNYVSTGSRLNIAFGTLYYPHRAHHIDHIEGPIASNIIPMVI